MNDFTNRKYLWICMISGSSKGGTVKLMSLEEALTVLLMGFLRGGNSFLKGTGEMIKGSSSVSREVRVGITQVSSIISVHLHVYLYLPCCIYLLLVNRTH